MYYNNSIVSWFICADSFTYSKNIFDNIWNNNTIISFRALSKKQLNNLSIIRRFILQATYSVVQ